MESTYTITPAVTRPRLAMPSTLRSFGSFCTWRAVKGNHVKHIVAANGDASGVPVWSSPHC